MSIDNAQVSVLVVEDNPADYELARQLMRSAGVSGQGYVLTASSSVSEAEERLAEQDFDAILLDLTLSDCEGFETYRRMRSAAPSTAIVVLTGLDDEQLGLRTIKEGAQEYLVKGQLSGALLVRTIRHSVERRRMENELAQYRDHLEQEVADRTRELERSYEKIQQAERLASIGALAAGIAHEINNPVSAIVLTAQNALEMCDELEGPDFMRRTCHKVLNNAQRCAQIVSGVLQFSRKQKTEKWPNDINVIVKSGIQLMRDATQRMGAVLRLELADDIPEVLANPIELEQVIVNLIQNSLQAGRFGVQILVSTERIAQGVKIRIKDNGRGISEEEIKHIFDPFYTTRRQDGGSGLGLSIVHGIVGGHGGTVHVESETGKGTEFVIELPCVEGD